MSVVSSSTLKKHRLSKKSERINEYKMLKRLGVGAFAKVKLCRHDNTGKTYAMKKMVKRDLKKKRFGMSQRTALDSAMDELMVLQ